MLGSLTHFEGGGIRNAYREICNNGEKLIFPHALEREVMCDLVDRQEKVVVGCTANDVGGQQELCRSPRRILEPESSQELNQNHGEDDPFR